MDPFSPKESVVILVAIFSQYAFGKRLGAASFFARVLLGVGFTACCVGFLANVCAYPIRHFIWTAIAVGAVLSLVDGWQAARLRKGADAWLVAGILVIGGLLLAFNLPREVYFFDAPTGETYLRFNTHYAYFSVQSSEMLQADYWSRLRVSNLYPYVWKKFHFFDASTQALAQGLVDKPGLFSYFHAKTYFMILILLSFLEQGVRQAPSKRRAVVGAAVWLCVVGSLFFDTFFWNFQTSGAFSIFAAVHLVLSLLRDDRRGAVLYSLVLGASAFRLMPVSLFLLGGIYFLFHWREGRRPAVSGRPGSWEWAGIAAFILYNAATGLLGESPARLMSFRPLSDGWIGSLYASKWAGYVLSYLSPGMSRFYFPPEYLEIFSARIPKGSALAVVFLFLTLLGAAFVAFDVFRKIQGASGSARALILGVPVGLAALLLTSRNYFFIFLLAVLHGTLLFFLATRTRAPGIAIAGWGRGTFLLVLGQVGALLFLLTGVDQMQGPVAMVLWEHLVAGVLLGALLYRENVVQAWGLYVGLFLFCLVFHPVQLRNILRLQDRHGYDLIRVTDVLRDPKARRTDVDGSRRLVRPVERPREAEALAAIHGARIPFSESHWRFMTFPFATRPSR